MGHKLQLVEQFQKLERLILVIWNMLMLIVLIGINKLKLAILLSGVDI